MKLTRSSYSLVTNQSTASNFTSQAYQTLNIDVEAVQVNYTGSPSGSFSVQGSVDGINYATLYVSVNGVPPSASVAVTANPSPILFDIYGSGIEWLQLVYTGSGTGSFSAFVCGKRLGG